MTGIEKVLPSLVILTDLLAQVDAERATEAAGEVIAAPPTRVAAVARTAAPRRHMSCFFIQVPFVGDATSRRRSERWRG